MQQPIPLQEHKLKLIKIIDESPEVKTFRVEVPQKNISFYSGQFFMVRFEGSKTLQRAYSIASSPEQKGHLDITMNLVAEFTNKLWKAKIGDYLIFKGPFGKFYFSEEMKNNLVLIGGGLGITPLMSIIRHCTDKKLQNKISLLYSARTPADIVYYNEIKSQKNQNPNLNYAITITRPLPEHKWQGKTGRIGISLLKESIESIEGSLYFLCGPLDFVKSIISMLESLGVKREQIKADIWG